MTPEETITRTQELLNSNRDLWEPKFVRYIAETNKHTNELLKNRSKFRICANLSVYTSIGKVMNNSQKFDLRYEGQSVGGIKIDKEGKVFLIIDKQQYKNNSNENYLIGYPSAICKQGKYDWRKSKQAKAFRRYFSSNPGKMKHPEHRFENILLREFNKKLGSDKSLKGIKPITIGTSKDLFFQLPTPLSASGQEVHFSNGKGGGIDILARRNNKLTVIELKDQNTTSEGPDKVITQAVAYATFIIELCKTAARNDFWTLCGFHNALTGKETINVSILMPEPKDGSVPSFTKRILYVSGSEMKMELHYMFFNPNTIKITRTSI